MTTGEYWWVGFPPRRVIRRPKLFMLKFDLDAYMRCAPRNPDGTVEWPSEDEGFWTYA